MATRAFPVTSPVSEEIRPLFESTSLAIWLEDWSAVAARCAELSRDGVSDLATVLDDDPELLHSIVELIDVKDANGAAARFVGAADRDTLVGPVAAELLTDDVLESFRDQIVAVANGKTHLQRVVSGIAFDGSPIDCQIDWSAAAAAEPDYSQVLVVIHDLGEQQAVARQMKRQVAQLETLLDIGKALTATFDVDAILALLAEASLGLTGAERSLILLFDTAAETITYFVSRGEWDDDIKYRSYDRVMSGIMGHAVRTRTATRAADIATDPRTSPDAVRFPGTSAVVAPILLDDVALGVLMTVSGPDRPEFTEMDVSLAKMLAGHAAVAIKNAALYREITESRDSVQRAHEELQQAQTQLLAAQKMEAIGSLAAGIAHEINTPIQFVSDNASFIEEAMGPLAVVARACTEFLINAGKHPELAEEAKAVGKLWREVDGEYLMDEIPVAVGETLEGAQRVAEIVRAMKEFAHPGSESKVPTDLNRVIRTTAQVSRNEWKYVAELELDLADDLPPVAGHPGPLGQSLLIMVVNSAQALAAHRGTDSAKGHIRVTTRRDGPVVEVRVADNGPGVPPEIVDRIFDPFFTTKEVGKGSGQGLSIARSIIVDKHGGELRVEDARPGAVFVIRLPIEDPDGDTI